ncbi:ABC transporter, ATP-binding protein, partial [human gut metagenome]
AKMISFEQGKAIFVENSLEYSREIHEKFEIYCNFMVEYNKNVNLTAITEPEEIWLKHFADSILLMNPFRNWPISALSFGQKKRVTIASVLVQQPELIILDEPTAGQDFRHYTDIMEFLRGLNEQGVTVVMITHDMHLMLEYTPRALVFCDGQLIADRSAAAVLCDPELIEQAALKETSLFTLANRCGIAPAEDFVERFIHEDREVRTHGC